ncbi:hypothetical protein PMZ80_002309 [Knufia obscura]|uniref:Uncharacterized protein n=1 Tax=Knufia obscura TaxID=1635080 RepID=A0ABR0RWZ8_9EURO|nr:hypothetical protein PMZ80_002309 [Knufia obscura]
MGYPDLTRQQSSGEGAKTAADPKVELTKHLDGIRMIFKTVPSEQVPMLLHGALQTLTKTVLGRDPKLRSQILTFLRDLTDEIRPLTPASLPAFSPGIGLGSKIKESPAEILDELMGFKDIGPMGTRLLEGHDQLTNFTRAEAKEVFHHVYKDLFGLTGLWTLKLLLQDAWDLSSKSFLEAPGDILWYQTSSISATYQIAIVHQKLDKAMRMPQSPVVFLWRHKLMIRLYEAWQRYIRETTTMPRQHWADPSSISRDGYGD